MLYAILHPTNRIGMGKISFHRRGVTITSFDEFNESLWAWCEKDAQREHYAHKIPIEELWQDDSKKLLILPEHPYSVFRYEALVADKTGFAVVDTNKYGLSPTLAGKAVQAKIYFDRIEFFYDHQPVGSFKRSFCIV